MEDIVIRKECEILFNKLTELQDGEIMETYFGSDHYKIEKYKTSFIFMVRKGFDFDKTFKKIKVIDTVNDLIYIVNNYPDFYAKGLYAGTWFKDNWINFIRAFKKKSLIPDGLC